MVMTWDDWDAHKYQFQGKAEAIMTDQTKCNECHQPLYVQRDRGVITCQGCNTVWFVRYEGKTPILHHFGTRQATTIAADEKKSSEAKEK